MPVTLQIVDNVVTDWSGSRCSSAESLLNNGTFPGKPRVSTEGLVQTSFSASYLDNNHISASGNGFVWAAYHAYSAHHHLRIRPEDVWFAILTQITFYINAHAEELRSFFVAHQGKKDLEAVSEIRDFALLAVQMGEIISNNVVDPGLKDWVLPGFSTTTYTDTVVGSILFMGAMKKYFNYKLTVCCGLPSVTLLGNVEDWEDILNRLDKLDLLGDEPRQFAAMLRPVLRRMIQSFTEPTSPEVLEFWNTIVHKTALSSGTDYLTGWLTAFCYWDEEGKAKGLPDAALDGTIKYKVDVDEVPPGLASVDVSVDDNGDLYEATLVAGSAGILATSSDTAPAARRQRVNRNTSPAQPGLDGDGPGVTSIVEGQQGDTCEVRPPIRDTVQPVSGWWMFKKG